MLKSIIQFVSLKKIHKSMSQLMKFVTTLFLLLSIPAQETKNYVRKMMKIFFWISATNMKKKMVETNCLVYILWFYFSAFFKKKIKNYPINSLTFMVSMLQPPFCTMCSLKPHYGTTFEKFSQDGENPIFFENITSKTLFWIFFLAWGLTYIFRECWVLSLPRNGFHSVICTF